MVNYYESSSKSTHHNFIQNWSRVVVFSICNTSPQLLGNFKLVRQNGDWEWGWISQISGSNAITQYTNIKTRPQTPLYHSTYSQSDCELQWTSNWKCRNQSCTKLPCPKGSTSDHGSLYLDEQLLNMNCLWWKFTIICFWCFFPMKIVKRRVWCTVSVVRNFFPRYYLQKRLILII